MELVELIGWFGTIVVLISFLVDDMRTLRILNIFGCLIFVAYGCLLNAVPIMIMNVAVILIHGYRLFKKK